MTTTTYYNLNIVEGTDIVNPLIVDNPNYEKIDEAMHDNAVAGVTFATEIANATVHAITRENSDCAVIRFIATSEWKAGDTATVDGLPVTALLPSGETLPDGAYVINANVLCILTGTNLTIYAERKKVENANEIRYNDTTVGAELDNINNNLKIKRLNNAEITSIGNHTLIDSIENYNAIIIVNSSSLHTFCSPVICINMGADTISMRRGSHIDGFSSGAYMCVYGEEFSITKNSFTLNSARKQYFNSTTTEIYSPNINIYGIK